MFRFQSLTPKFTHSSTQLRLAALVLALLFGLFAATPLPIVRAQSPDHANVIVRNDGARFTIPSSSRTYMPSHANNVKPGSLVNTRIQSKYLPSIGTPSPESVIGEDGRSLVSDTTISPSSAIVQLEISFPDAFGTCTGWFIDAYRVATAGHCLYDISVGGFAQAITVNPARNGDTLPFGSFAATNWYVPHKFTLSAKPRLDYGVVVLGTNVGDTVGWFGYMQSMDDARLLNRRIQVRGYPVDKSPGTMWSMKGTVASLNNTRFFYTIDTYAGQSGSPAFGKFQDCNPCVFGIHTYGVGGAWDKNSATRIREKVFNFLAGAGVPNP